MTNKFLEKVALRRIISEIAKGTVSTSFRKLNGLGFLKSPEVYAKGMALGNSNIASKIGAKIHTPRTALDKITAQAGGGYSSVAVTKNKFKVLHPKVDIPDVTHQGMIRHELFEAQDLKKVMHEPSRKWKLDNESRTALKDYMGNSYNEKSINARKFIKADSFTNNGNLVGLHATPRVLTRESEMVRKNPYLEHLKDIRVYQTGEASIVKSITGKTYGVDKMTGKDHLKAFNASKTALKSENVIAHKNHGT